MRFGIVGAGVAGSYLACMLQKQGYNVEVFEMSEKENHWGVCAWGGSKDVLAKFSKQAGLDFNEYVFHNSNKLKIIHADNTSEVLKTVSLVTYNKHNWECDLLEGITVNYGVRFTSQTFPSDRYDYVIDCTGVHRDLLPASKEDFTTPSLEYLVENVRGTDSFYVENYNNAHGYFWFFPLSEGKAYVGAIDFERKYRGIKEFFHEHPEAKIIKKIGRPLRLSPPQRMKPFYNKNIIGVGESIGCVFPITGEGIGPSLECCDIFLKVVVMSENNNNIFSFDEYEKRILSAFDYYDDAYKILKLVVGTPNLRSSLGSLDFKKIVPNDRTAAARIKQIAMAVEILSALAVPSENS